MNKFYITTAIDYVNDTIHIGHAFQKIAADVIARYERTLLGEDNVFFLTGTDEYGKKAEKAALEQGIPTKDFVKKISDSDQKQQNTLHISYNRFIRTTDRDHAKVAQEIWNRVLQNGDIYLGNYKGLYCEGCEAYYSKSDLVNGHCPNHPSLEIRNVNEKNYFFRWSKYKDFLISHIKNNPDFIFPKLRAVEMLKFAKKIKDIPISRTDFTWGVEVPDNPKHIMYVWFDALTNYLTGVGFLEDQKLFEKFWPADIHILGKDNLRWHSLLWPAMLKSACIELPKKIIVNGFLTINGRKISKSLGNVIRPADWVENFGADAVRFYLLRYTVLTEDGDVSEEKLKQAYNSDLANGLGNLVSRASKLAEKNNVFIKPYSKSFDLKIKDLLNQFRFNEALIFLWADIAKADKFVNDKKIWELSGIVAQRETLDLLEQIQRIAFNLSPFLPETSNKILKLLSGRVRSQKPLFPRIP